MNSRQYRKWLRRASANEKHRRSARIVSGLAPGHSGKAWKAFTAGKRAAHTGMMRALRMQRTCDCCAPESLQLLYVAGSLMRLEADHRVALALGGTHCVRNLILMTRKQHARKTRLDLQAIRAARR
jgi:hypothetical protein